MSKSECKTCDGTGVYPDPDAWNTTTQDLTNCPECNPEGKIPEKLPNGNGLVT